MPDARTLQPWTRTARPRQGLLVLALWCTLTAPPVQPQEVDLDDLLDLELTSLAEVEVLTATRRLQPLSGAPATVRIVTAEQIRQRGYRTLEDVLADLPGLQFRNIQGFNSYVFMRGLPNQNNLILLMIDGVEINELNSGGFYGGAQFDLANVKRVEVVYGPESALYGTNAVSGIVHLITFGPADDRGPRAQAMVGSFDTSSAGLGISRFSKERDSGFSLSSVITHSDLAELGGEDGDSNWTSGMENFSEDSSFHGKVTWKGFDLGLLVHDKSSSRTTNDKAVDTEFLDRGSEWNIRFVNTSLRHNWIGKDGRSLETTAIYRDTTVLDDTVAFVTDAADGTRGQVGYYRPNSSFTLESTFRMKIGEQVHLVGGIAWERERLSRSFSVTQSLSPDVPPPRPSTPPLTSQELWSGFLQGQMRIFPKGELTLGLRHDESDYYGSATTSRLGYVQHLGTSTAKLLYSEAFRAPKPWDLTFGIGNPDLQPEEMRSFELVLLRPMARGDRLRLALYKNRLERALVQDLDIGGERWVNAGHFDTEGVEVEIEGERNRVRWFGNYSYTESEDAQGQGVPEIARHGANLGAHFDWTARIGLDLRAQFLGRRPNPQVIATTGENHVEAATLLHATLSIHALGPFDLRLIVRNLLDEETYHTSNRPPDRYRQPQRGFFLALDYGLR